MSIVLLEKSDVDFEKNKKRLDKSQIFVYTTRINRGERGVAEQMHLQRAAGGVIAAGQNREWTFEGEPNPRGQ